MTGSVDNRTERQPLGCMPQVIRKLAVKLRKPSLTMEAVYAKAETNLNALTSKDRKVQTKRVDKTISRKERDCPVCEEDPWFTEASRIVDNTDNETELFKGYEDAKERVRDRYDENVKNKNRWDKFRKNAQIRKDFKNIESNFKARYRQYKATIEQYTPGTEPGQEPQPSLILF